MDNDIIIIFWHFLRERESLITGDIVQAQIQSDNTTAKVQKFTPRTSNLNIC